MLYILLIIIAIGVLNISEEGKELLRALSILALIAGGLYLAFWIVVIAIGLLSDKGIRDTIFNFVAVMGGIILAGYAFYRINKVLESFRKGDYTVKSISDNIKKDLLRSGIKTRRL